MGTAGAKKSMSPAAIVALVGGALLVVGPLLTWMTATFNLEKIAEILGVDPQLIQQSGALPGSTAAKGLDSDMHGLVALIAGVIVIAGGIILIVALEQRVLGGVLILIGGLLGAAMPIWDLIRKEQALDELSKGLGAIPGVAIGDVVTVSAGVGLWVALAGGVVATIGGIMALMSKSAAAPAMADGAAMGTGFETPAAAAAPAPMASTEPDAPEVAPDMPEVAPDMPEVAPDMPEVAPDMPEVAPDMPESAPDMPEVPKDPPGSTA